MNADGKGGDESSSSGEAGEVDLSMVGRCEGGLSAAGIPAEIRGWMAARGLEWAVSETQRAGAE